MNQPVYSATPPGLADLPAQWGWLVARGVAAILFGVLALTLPGLTALTLAVAWGTYVVFDGVFALSYAACGRGARRATYLFIGLAGIVAGVIAVFWPQVTEVVLVMIIGIWAFVIGLTEMGYAMHYRRKLAKPLTIGLAGLLSAVVGFFLALFPGQGALSLIMVIGAYAIVYGVLMSVGAFALRHYGHIDRNVSN